MHPVYDNPHITKLIASICAAMLVAGGVLAFGAIAQTTVPWSIYAGPVAWVAFRLGQTLSAARRINRENDLAALAGRLG